MEVRTNSIVHDLVLANVGEVEKGQFEMRVFSRLTHSRGTGVLLKNMRLEMRTVRGVILSIAQIGGAGGVQVSPIESIRHCINRNSTSDTMVHIPIFAHGLYKESECCTRVWQMIGSIPYVWCLSNCVVV